MECLGGWLNQLQADIRSRRAEPGAPGRSLESLGWGAFDRVADKYISLFQFRPGLRKKTSHQQMTFQSRFCPVSQFCPSPPEKRKTASRARSPAKAATSVRLGVYNGAPHRHARSISCCLVPEPPVRRHPVNASASSPKAISQIPRCCCLLTLSCIFQSEPRTRASSSQRTRSVLEFIGGIAAQSSIPRGSNTQHLCPKVVSQTSMPTCRLPRRGRHSHEQP
ncbi:uncharacterized protein B0H64DRAFT_118899 [Chaetomium fimeti]|uniref:Uncharacterized protein n=1 Tax=Chaetomium fimeti TaxID=1854472 RepID=A0AAE0HIE7_9PEZI|nr:hypothetical protein B0H64DRAFT_118899 [Chaetomium fimeti]